MGGGEGGLQLFVAVFNLIMPVSEVSKEGILKNNYLANFNYVLAWCCVQLKLSEIIDLGMCSLVSWSRQRYS